MSERTRFYYAGNDEETTGKSQFVPFYNEDGEEDVDWELVDHESGNVTARDKRNFPCDNGKPEDCRICRMSIKDE